MGGVAAVACGAACSGGAPVVSPLARQHAFNRPTDGVAQLEGKGNTVAVHWQAISSIGYQSVNFNILVTKDGIGDNRLVVDDLHPLPPQLPVTLCIANATSIELHFAYSYY